MSRRIKPLANFIGCVVSLLIVGMIIGILMASVIAENDRHRSVTGYFGLDGDGMPITAATDQ